MLEALHKAHQDVVELNEEINENTHQFSDRDRDLSKHTPYFMKLSTVLAAETAEDQHLSIKALRTILGILAQVSMFGAFLTSGTQFERDIKALTKAMKEDKAEREKR
jgi:hypothetical protein